MNPEDMWEGGPKGEVAAELWRDILLSIKVATCIFFFAASTFLCFHVLGGGEWLVITAGLVDNIGEVGEL